MTAQPQRPSPDTTALEELLVSLPGGAIVAHRVLAELAEVRVAHEELRVAEEELRAQQDQLRQLLQQYDTERRWSGHLAALVPFGLCVTDGAGALVDVNPALARLLGTGLQRLHGKPLSLFLAAADVSAFRSALRTLGTGVAEQERLTVTLTPRHALPAGATVFGFPHRPDQQVAAVRVQWVVLPDDGPGTATAPTTSAEEAARDLDVVGLAAALAAFAELPAGETDRQRLLGRMAVLVRSAVPAGDWVSITLGSPAEPQRLGTDSAAAQDFDGRQLQVAGGPCWDAHRTGAVVVADDVTTDPRWPELARLAGGSRVRSVIAVPVLESGGVAGVVNVYSHSTGAFTPSGRRIAELAAAAVAGVLQSVAEREAVQELADGMERALGSRAVIDQAKGMVMLRLGVDAEDAFARLVALSSRLDVKLRDLATLMVEGHVDALLRTGAEPPGR